MSSEQPFDEPGLRLTPAEFHQIKLWLDEKDVSQTCRACFTGKYELLDYALRIPVTTPDGSAELSRHMGVVPVRCTNCAHIELFDTGVIGIRRSMT